MRKKFLAGLATVLFLIGTAGMTTANIIDDIYGAGAGSFELGNFFDGGGAYMWLSPGATNIEGWTVGGPGDGVDWLLGSYYGADTGLYAMDLQHLSASSISTTIPTITGHEYELSFSSATSLGYSNSGVISAGSLTNQTFIADISPQFPNAFSPFSFIFTATGPTTMVQFMSVGLNTAYGPAIDSVSVEPVSVPTTLVLFGTGIAGLAGFRIMRKKQ